MFAGFGSLMSVVDKVRGKSAPAAPSDAKAAPAPAATATATETPAKESAAAEAVAPETVAPETAAETAAVAPEATAETEPAAAEPVVAAAAEPVVAAASPVAETAVEPTEAGDASALPLANYEELTVASLRARLRNLTNDDLNQLMAYEKAHQNRPEVIKMFQNRLIKMTTELPKLEA
jgi:hypothetical protein